MKIILTLNSCFLFFFPSESLCSIFACDEFPRLTFLKKMLNFITNVRINNNVISRRFRVSCTMITSKYVILWIWNYILASDHGARNTETSRNHVVIYSYVCDEINLAQTKNFFNVVNRSFVIFITIWRRRKDFSTRVQIFRTFWKILNQPRSQSIPGFSMFTNGTRYYHGKRGHVSIGNLK